MNRVITRGEWGRIIATAWLDPTFAHELSTDPSKAVKSFLALDPDSEVIVFEIPAKPGDLPIRNSKMCGVAGRQPWLSPSIAAASGVRRVRLMRGAEYHDRSDSVTRELRM